MFAQTLHYIICSCTRQAPRQPLLANPLSLFLSLSLIHCIGLYFRFARRQKLL